MAIFVISLTLLGRALVIVNKSWKQAASQLERPKGVFRVNETECHYNVVLAKREDNNIGENVRKLECQKMYKA